MSPTAIALILAAAIAHASWNLFSKQAAATGAAFFLWLIAMCAAVIYLPIVAGTMLAEHPHLTSLNWVFLVGTGFLHSGYFLFLQLGYRLGDLSMAYPIGRGSGALLAAVAGIVLLGERPGPLAGAGILAIIAGVVAIGLPGRQRVAATATAAARAGQGHGDTPQAAGPDQAAGQDQGTGPDQAAGQDQGTAARADLGRAIGFALATGAFIACYTIWDKYAVADLRTPPILQGYAGFPVMIIVFTPFVLRDRARLASVWRSFKPQVLGTAVLSPLAYILVLVALSFTAVSVVAPAREVSVLFGVLLGRRLLGEGSIARRLAAAAAIVAGIIAIAIG